MEEILYTPILVIHVVACLFLVLVVLLQPGKSGGLGALSGAGAQQVFGGRGAGNILTRITWITAGTFFVTSITLAFLSSSGDKSMQQRGADIGVIDEAPITAPTGNAEGASDEPTPPAKPAAPTEPTPEESDPASSETETAAPEDAAKDEGAEGAPSPEPSAPSAPVEPASPKTPALPLDPAPAAPKPAAPAPAAPKPATPAPVAPAPAAPKPAAPTPAAPGPAPGDSPY